MTTINNHPPKELISEFFCPVEAFNRLALFASSTSDRMGLMSAIYEPFLLKDYHCPDLTTSLFLSMAQCYVENGSDSVDIILSHCVEKDGRTINTFALKACLSVLEELSTNDLLHVFFNTSHLQSFWLI